MKTVSDVTRFTVRAALALVMLPDALLTVTVYSPASLPCRSLSVRVDPVAPDTFCPSASATPSLDH